MTKSSTPRSAIIVLAMVSGALLVLAGCPAGKTPEPPAKPDPAAPVAPAPPSVKLGPQISEPAKNEDRKSAEPQQDRPASLTLPAAEKPAARPADRPAEPAAKPVLTAPPKPSAEPGAKPASTTAQVPSIRRPVDIPVMHAPVKPLVTVAPPPTTAPSATLSRQPPSLAGDPVRSPPPGAETPLSRPLPLPISPPYTAPGGWTARPNPLRGGEAPPAGSPTPADSRPVAASPKPDASPMSNELPNPRTPPRAEATVVAATTPGTPVADQRHIEPGMGRGATKKTSFDPIKENGPIFVGWPKPRAALVITGRQDGYIEPCGCAGLDRMKGGISRRHTLFEQLRGQGWPIVCMDLGDISKGFGRQAELKFQTTVEALKRMGYHAIGVGTNDLRLPGAELLSVAKGVDNQQSPFISANVGLFTFDPPMIDPYRVIPAGGLKVGVTAVLGKQEQKQVQNGDVLKEDPETKLAEILPRLKQEADYLVLLAFASAEEATRLARRFPEFKVVVTAGGGPEPPAEPARIDGKTLLIEVGEKGMNAIVVGLYDDAERPWRYQRVPLDSRFKNSPEMRMLMESYQDQLKSLGYAGLGLRAVPHPQKKLMGGFVGSEKCEACHEESYRVWKKSGHARAYHTLASLIPPRNFDPECIACHVIGWHPQEYFPYEGGFNTLETTPKLIDVGCESCHGPGASHVAAEQTDNNEKLQSTLRKAMVVTKEEAHQRMCLSCHDGDNSPDFKFETYWPHVEHYEKK